MKLKLLGLFVGAGLFSTMAAAETIHEQHRTINVLEKGLLTIEDIVTIKHDGIDGIEELIQLGDFYSYDETYRDSYQSFNYYTVAARQGSEYAKMMVGYMTYKGYGTTKNIFKGEHLLENIKKPYDKNASYLLALNYLDDGKTDKAIELFKTIKDTQSYRYLTKELIHKREFNDAIPYLEWLIDEKNDIGAKRELAIIMLKPEFSQEHRAVSLFTEAANQGDSKSQYRLGYFYHKGTANTVADIDEAVKWYSISSQNGNLFARQELLKIWNYNGSHNNAYGLDHDPYLNKIVQEQYTSEMDK